MFTQGREARRGKGKREEAGGRKKKKRRRREGVAEKRNETYIDRGK